MVSLYKPLVCINVYESSCTYVYIALGNLYGMKACTYISDHNFGRHGLSKHNTVAINIHANNDINLACAWYTKLYLHT